ncbi:MAG TPA: hypothetical protein VGM09_02855 [Bradyrhizobium sp.]|jgi:hypothetical protein
MVDSASLPIFDANDLEREIKEEIRNWPPFREPQPVDFAPPAIRGPVLSKPEGGEHRDETSAIGKLWADAVVSEYEAASREIETLGTELIERVKQCEEMTRDALSVTEEMKEIAARYRGKARRIVLEIENCSLVTAEVRKTCNELTQKIAGPARMDRKP